MSRKVKRPMSCELEFDGSYPARLGWPSFVLWLSGALFWAVNCLLSPLSLAFENRTASDDREL
jgi:hypothetical protein